MAVVSTRKNHGCRVELCWDWSSSLYRERKDKLTIIETTARHSTDAHCVKRRIRMDGLYSRLNAECLTGQLAGSESSDMMEEFPSLLFIFVFSGIQFQETHRIALSLSLGV